jgi:N-acetyl sugar amidotransferase
MFRIEARMTTAASISTTSAAVTRPVQAAPSPTRYQICARCIMDTTDPAIVFDEQGVCNHCKLIADNRDRYWLPDERGHAKLEALIAKIKQAGRGREYDCIMGLSGGVDSSYLAMKAHEWGLRVLAVHVDGGWNTQLAVRNIERMIAQLGFDLYTFVIDWEEMRDLQIAFLKAGVPNQDVPQDHAFFAGLYRETARQRIRYVLTGGNYATESILPAAWGYSAMDLIHLRAIHKQFGSRPLRKFPQLGFFYFNFYLPKIKKVRIEAPMDLMPYSKSEAIRELQQKFGWQYYGGKHYESRFTRFFQAYYLPTRFGFDKRRAHLASLVASGEINRDRALAEMQQPLYEPAELEKDKEFVLKKLGLNESEFAALLNAPLRQHRELPTDEWLHRVRWASTLKERAGITIEHLAAARRSRRTFGRERS